MAVKGTLRLIGTLDGTCFTTWEEAAKAFERFFSVEIDTTSLSNIIISTQQPGEADRNKIWWRIGNNGSFVGIFFYSDGQWVQVYPAPNQIFWLYGSSDTPPPGFSFTTVETIFSNPDYAALIAQAIPNTGPPYRYYPAVYVGL